MRPTTLTLTLALALGAPAATAAAHEGYRDEQILAVAGAALLTAAVLEAESASTFAQLRGSCAPNCTAAQVLPLQREIDGANALFVTGALVAAATAVALVVAWARAPRR